MEASLTSDLSADLNQVRIAYRLVVAYQRRLLDLVRLVQRGVREQHRSISFESWSPTHWSRPGATDLTQKWAWDFVPLHHFDVGWVSAGQPGPGAFWFWLTHEADTGWETDGTGEPDPFEFAPAETCQTMLCASVLGIPRAAVQGETAGGWQRLYEGTAQLLEPQEWKDGAVRQHEVNAATIRTGGFRLCLDTLGNKDLVTTQVTEPLLKLIDETIG
jgi:hypothetical protein